MDFFRHSWAVHSSIFAMCVSPPDPAQLMSHPPAPFLQTHLAKVGRIGGSDQSHGAKEEREAVKAHG